MSYNFAVLDDISKGKDLSKMNDHEYQKGYLVFYINKAFMQSKRTVMIANEANKAVLTDKEWHYSFMCAMITGSLKGIKWQKKDDKNEYIPFVMKEYNVGESHAARMLEILTKEQCEALVYRHREGGVVKKGKAK